MPRVMAKSTGVLLRAAGTNPGGITRRAVRGIEPLQASDRMKSETSSRK